MRVLQENADKINMRIVGICRSAYLAYYCYPCDVFEKAESPGIEICRGIRSVNHWTIRVFYRSGSSSPKSSWKKLSKFTGTGAAISVSIASCDANSRSLNSRREAITLFSGANMLV